MRILSAHLGAFGAFRDLVLDDLDHAVLVVEGQNEAGKSTLFHFVKGMLYGLHPPDAKAYPYVPRGHQADGLRGRLRYRLPDDRTLTVTRRLRRAPAGELVEAEQTTELGNRTVPACRHVPRAVYDAVYALTRGDLTALDGRAWGDVQDRLMGGTTDDALRPARVVAAELEAEADARWRPDERPDTEAAALDERRRTLAAALDAARARDARLRTRAAEADALDDRLDDLRAEQVRLRVEQRRARRLAPVRTRLRAIARLEAEAGDLAPYADLPDDPQALLERLDDAIGALEAQAEYRRSALLRLQRTADAFTDADRQVLAHADAIRHWGKRVDGHQRLLHRFYEARRAEKGAQKHLEGVAREVLGQPWTDAYAEALRTLALPDVRAAAHALTHARARRDEVRARAETLHLREATRRSLTPWLALAGLGAAVLAVGVAGVLPAALAAGVGGALLVVGAAQAYAARRANDALDRQAEALDLPAAEADVAQRREAVLDLLRDLPLADAFRDALGLDLVEALGRLREALRARDAADEQAIEAAEAAEAQRDEVRRLAEACGRAPDDDAPVAALVADLEPRLADAARRRTAAQEAERERPALRPEVETLARELTKRRDRRADVRRRLKALGKEDRGEASVEAGLAALAARRAAARRATLTRDALHQEHPDWARLEAEIDRLDAAFARRHAGSGNDGSGDDGSGDDGGNSVSDGAEDRWTYSDARRAEIDARLDALDDEIDRAQADHDEARAEVEQLAEQPTVAALESTMAVLDRRHATLCRARDRRRLLAHALRRADHAVRLRRQPAVLQQASAYAERLTDGRHARLTLEEDSGRLLLHARDGATQPLDGARAALSHGTRDAVHLALRLAVAHHLDADHALLPLLFDDVFVRLDDARRAATFDLLDELTAAGRQLFFFTCHPGLVGDLASRFDDVGHLALDRLRAPTTPTG